ncbi:MAG: cation-translocating P-type ATPase [Deltaproteobacteria bacterium]|nr:cation-translocating P-type ATPase [Deltaproteobacteria bacterium]
MSDDGLNSFQLDIEGMSCTSCAARIEKGLQADLRVNAATVNFATKTAVVTTSARASEIAALIRSLGYKANLSGHLDKLEEREQRELNEAKRMAALAAALALPVFILAMIFPPFPGSAYMQAVLTLALMVGPGRGFFLRASKQLRLRSLGMDTLVSMGTGVAFCYSVYLQLDGHAHYYYESVAVIIAFVLLGKFLEERARQQISTALRQLAKLRPETAQLWQCDVHGEETVTPVAAALLKSGDFVLVRVGERIPVDGVCERGDSTVNAAMMTGESIPTKVEPGTQVMAGTLNLSGPIVIKAIGVGSDTELARIVGVVEAAQNSKAPIQRLADQVASWFVPAAMLTALFTWLAWTVVTGSATLGLSPAVAVLVVACPCTLGLATPVAIMAATGIAAKHGILIRDAMSLQTLHKVDTLVFDKTGTLTTGQMEVDGCHIVMQSIPRTTILSAARALEIGSLHPVAAAVVRFIDTELSSKKSLAAQDVTERPGYGVTGKFIGIGNLTIGSLDHCKSFDNYQHSKSLLSPNDLSNAVALSDEKSVLAVFAIKDHLRPDAASAIAQLKRLGVRSIIASGDRADIVAAIARSVGDIPFHAPLTPKDKATLVQDLRAGGRVVAMAGDGINDAPALAVADVGLAMGSGAEAAVAVAGVIIRDNAVTKITEAMQLSRATFRNIKENLFWAFAYNAILIPAAALGRLSPMLAGAAMGLSSLFVVGNALRLKTGWCPNK